MHYIVLETFRGFETFSLCLDFLNVWCVIPYIVAVLGLSVHEWLKSSIIICLFCCDDSRWSPYDAKCSE